MSKMVKVVCMERKRCVSLQRQEEIYALGQFGGGKVVHTVVKFGLGFTCIEEAATSDNHTKKNSG